MALETRYVSVTAEQRSAARKLISAHLPLEIFLRARARPLRSVIVSFFPLADVSAAQKSSQRHVLDGVLVNLLPGMYTALVYYMMI